MRKKIKDRMSEKNISKDIDGAMEVEFDIADEEWYPTVQEIAELDIEDSVDRQYMIAVILHLEDFDEEAEKTRLFILDKLEAYSPLLCEAVIDKDDELHELDDE